MRISTNHLVFLGVMIYGLISSHAAIAQEKVILYTFYTESHKQLLTDWFLPSIQDEFEIIVKKLDQLCPSGTYMNTGWTQTMLGKIDLILTAIEQHHGDIIIYADIDIQFFEPIEQSIRECIQNYDLVLQKDCNTGPVCAGFMALRANNATLDFFNTVRAHMIAHPGKSDQPTINQLLLQDRSTSIRWNYLPDTFFGTGTLSFTHFANKRTWQEGDVVVMPPHIKLHHANYTTSIENKIKLLAYVKQHRNDRETSLTTLNRTYKEKRKKKIEQRAQQRKAQGKKR